MITKKEFIDHANNIKRYTKQANEFANLLNCGDTFVDDIINELADTLFKGVSSNISDEFYEEFWETISYDEFDPGLLHDKLKEE